MRSCRAISALLLTTLFVIASTPARAGNAGSDYALLEGGLAPNKQMSLASRGEDDAGALRVWLMAEPAHRRIASLPDIVETYHGSTPEAVWSTDSRHVAVLFRSSRNQQEFRLYDIEGSRVRIISGPRLFKEATHRDVTNSDGAYLRYYAIVWRDSGRFVLREYQSFDPSAGNDLLQLLGAYGHASRGNLNGHAFVEFAAEADCQLGADHRYRIVDLRPRDPDIPLGR